MSSIILQIKKDKAGGRSWVELSAQGPSATHIICGEQTWQGSRISLFGGHRVQEYKFKKNVHWSIVTGFELDISAVQAPLPAAPPRRQGQRHNKR